MQPKIVHVQLEYSPEKDRVFVRAVHSEHKALDPMEPDNQTNVVSVFVDTDMQQSKGFTFIK